MEELDTTESFIENREEESNAMIVDYIKEVLTIEGQIKELKDNIKDNKKEAKSNGVPVVIAHKAITKLKAIKKMSMLEKQEQEDVISALESDSDIALLLANLNT